MDMTEYDTEELSVRNMYQNNMMEVWNERLLQEDSEAAQDEYDATYEMVVNDRSYARYLYEMHGGES